MSKNNLSKDTLNLIKCFMVLIIVIVIYYYCIKPFIYKCVNDVKENKSMSMVCKILNMFH